jgi:hypothetical protein
VVGKSIATDGDVFNSPGVQNVIDLKISLDKLPTNFNFEKKVLNNMYQKRYNTDILI